MKKRIFTLLALAMLLYGTTTLKAQIQVTDVSIVPAGDGYIHETKETGTSISKTIMEVEIGGIAPTDKEVTVFLATMIR